MIPLTSFDYQLIVHVEFDDSTKNDLKFSLNEQESAINSFRDFANNPHVLFVTMVTNIHQIRETL